MTRIVTLKGREFLSEFTDWAESNRLEYSRIGALESIVMTSDEIDEKEPPEFVLSVEDADQKVDGAQRISVGDRSLPDAGNWGLVRHIHKENPWGFKGVRFPVYGDFNCYRTGVGVDIYVVDQYIWPHSELEGRLTNVWDGYPESPPTLQSSHGLAVATTAAGAYSGFARNSKVFGFRGLGNDNTGSASVIINAIGQALSHYRLRAPRPGVLNMSIEGVSVFAWGSSALSDCAKEGLVPVVAAGNSSIKVESEYNNAGVVAHVVTVGAIEPGDTPARFTNYGTGIDLLAAGVRMHLPYATTGGSIWANGTSFSAPSVAGAMACVLEDYDRLSGHKEVSTLLAYMQKEASWNTYRPLSSKEPMTRAILYLNPGIDYPRIPEFSSRSY